MWRGPAILYALIGIAFFGVASWIAWGSARFRIGARSTTGRVIGIRLDKTRSHFRHPDFEFEVEGRVFRNEVQIGGSYSDVRVGDPVQVLYRPEDPEGARLDNFWDLWGLAIILSAASGVSFLVAGIAFKNGKAD